MPKIKVLVFDSVPPGLQYAEQAAFDEIEISSEALDEINEVLDGLFLKMKEEGLTAMERYNSRMRFEIYP